MQIFRTKRLQGPLGVERLQDDSRRRGGCNDVASGLGNRFGGGVDCLDRRRRGQSVFDRRGFRCESGCQGRTYTDVLPFFRESDAAGRGRDAANRSSGDSRSGGLPAVLVRRHRLARARTRRLGHRPGHAYVARRALLRRTALMRPAALCPVASGALLSGRGFESMSPVVWRGSDCRRICGADRGTEGQVGLVTGRKGRTGHRGLYG